MSFQTVKNLYSQVVHCCGQKEYDINLFDNSKGAPPPFESVTGNESQSAKWL